MYRVKGLGAFVGKRKTKSELPEIKNIADEIRNRGREYNNEVKLLEDEPIDQHIAYMRWD